MNRQFKLRHLTDKACRKRSRRWFLISPVFTKLEAAVEHQKEIASYNASAEFKGLLTIISDRNVPFSLISQAMYTAGQAGFTKFKFLVVKGG